MKVFTCLWLAGLWALSMPAFSQQAQHPQGQGQGQGQGQERREGGERRGPPPEALAACKSLASGAACSFTSPRGAVSGSCFAPEGKPLACRPQRDGDGQPGTQPKKPRS